MQSKRQLAMEATTDAQSKTEGKTFQTVCLGIDDGCRPWLGNSGRAKRLQERWCKLLIKTVTVITLYVALASVLVWYREISFLGLSPSK